MRSGRRIAAVVALGASATLVCGGIAAADVRTDSTVDWNAVFPIAAEVNPVVTETVATLPSPVAVGAGGVNVPITVTDTLPWQCSSMFWQVSENHDVQTTNAIVIQGTETVTVTTTDSAGRQASQSAALTITPTLVALTTGSGWAPTTFAAQGTLALPPIPDAGPALVSLGAVSLTLDPIAPDGGATFFTEHPQLLADIPLRLDPTGPSQNPANSTSLGTVDVTS